MNKIQACKMAKGEAEEGNSSGGQQLDDNPKAAVKRSD